MPWGRADTGSPDLAEAYRQHREEIYRYLFGKTHDREQAEDLTQEVFTAALVARPTLAGDSGSLLPWLYVVARRRYIDSRRHNLTTGTLCVPLDMAHAVPARVPMLEGAALVDALVEAIRGLPAAQRRVCLMRLFEGRHSVGISRNIVLGACLGFAAFGATPEFSFPAFAVGLELVLLIWLSTEGVAVFRTVRAAGA